MADSWSDYLDQLGDAVRRYELEMAFHPGLVAPIDEVCESGAPVGPLPADLVDAASALWSKMQQMIADLERQMDDLAAIREANTANAASGYMDPQSVYIDTRA